MSRLELLRTVGTAIYGKDWQSPLARALGPLRPTGPKQPLALRYVQMWASEARPVPAWVEAALVQLIHEEAGRRRADAARFDAMADELSRASRPSGLGKPT